MIEAAKVGDLLSYEAETGVLTWRWRSRELFARDRDWRAWNTMYAGRPALTAKHGAGYRHGALLGRNKLAHRAAWAVAKGVWPPEVDHINGDRSDNRLCNLRAVTPQENRRNSGAHRGNRSGVNGVFLKPSGRWLANILVDGKTRHLGLFDSLAEAAAARHGAERALGYHPNHGKRPSHSDSTAARAEGEANNPPSEAAP